MSPVLQHLAMGLGLGAMGFLLVLGIRGGSDERDEREVRDPHELAALGDATSEMHDAHTSVSPGDASAPGDAAMPSRDAFADAVAPPPEPAPPAPPPIFRVASLAADASFTVTDGTLGHRALLSALAAAGVGRAESYKITHAIGRVHNLNHGNPNDVFHIAKEKGSGHVVAFEYVTSPVDVFQARDEGGALTATKLDLHVQTRRVALPVTVASDLRAAFTKAGFEEDIVQRVDDALDGHAELSDVHAGSRFRVLATEQRLAGVFLRYAAVDALEYTPAERSASVLRVYRFPAVDPEKVPAVGTTHPASYYDAKGQQPYHGGWRIPVPSARIASRFNPRRMHPTLHVIMPHNGVDFAAPTGTPIYAAASGTVKTAGDSGLCGNMVQIEHNAGLISSYCHMSKFAAGIHVGQHVDTRQLIGYVGQTGRATGPHLHFAIKRNGIFIDPLAMKLDGVRVVPPSQRDEFDALRDELDKALDAIVVDKGDAGPQAPPDGASASPSASDAPVDDQVFDEVPAQ